MAETGTAATAVAAGGSGDSKGGDAGGDDKGTSGTDDKDGDDKGDDSGKGSLLGNADAGGKKSLAGGAGLKEGSVDVKDGDLLSMKKAGGSDKTAAEFMTDKAEAEKAAAGKDNSNDDAGAPEKYTDFNLPEGVSKLSDDNTTELHALLKGMSLSQENSQKLVDFQAKIAIGTSDAAINEFDKTTDKWADDTKKMFGANYGEKLGVAAKAIERFGPKGLRGMFDDTMVGNHPLLNEFLYNVGKAISEDALVEGKNKAPEKTTAEKFYPNMAKKQPN